jgi:hypothetical protein
VIHIDPSEHGTIIILQNRILGFQDVSGVVSEWLRREIRNLLGSPAQVRILSTSVFLFALQFLFSFSPRLLLLVIHSEVPRRRIYGDILRAPEKVPDEELISVNGIIIDFWRIGRSASDGWVRRSRSPRIR